MNPFELRPEFIELDNRKNRKHNPSTAENHYIRFSKLLPPEKIKGKTILDLGACIGALGYWCEFHGAKSYTGVELQEDYYNRMNDLFSESKVCTAVHSDLFDFLRSTKEKYDIVILAGVLYAFIDYYRVLDEASDKALEMVCIDTARPEDDNIPIAYLPVNMNSALGGSFREFGVRIEPNTLAFLMDNLGFNIVSYHGSEIDISVYRENKRYISIFKKGNSSRKNFQELLKNGSEPYTKWKF